MSNKVLITNDQKAVKVPSGLRILIRRACTAVLEYEKFDRPAEISVTFVDNAKIAELNNGTIDCVWNGMTLSDDVKEAMSCTKAYCNNAQVVVTK